MTGIHVKLKEDFSVVRETLTRVGIINHKTKKVTPSCYCVPTTTSNDDGIYAIVHFKELFPYFDRETDYNEDDEIRRNTITFLLKNWNLIEIVNPKQVESIQSKQIHVLPYEKKKDYKIDHKIIFSKKITVE